MQTIEIWKDIEELDNDYQVSNFGRIKSKERYVEYDYNGTTRIRKVDEKILKPKIVKVGNRIDKLEINIKRKSFIVSRLVYCIFNNDFDIPNGYCIAHKNKNALDNSLENLVKVTRSESCKIDYAKSEFKKKAQMGLSKLGAKAMKRKAFFRKLKFFNADTKEFTTANNGG